MLRFSSCFKMGIQGRIQDLWKGGGGAAATVSAAGANDFGGSRLKTLFGISKGGRAPPAGPPPPESASGIKSSYQ